MRKLTLALFLLWIATLCQAQSYMAPLPSSDILNPGTPNHIRWGPEIGLNYNFFSSTQYIADANAEGINYIGTDNDLEGSASGFGFLAGIAVDFPISSSVGILLSAHYDSKPVSKTANEPVTGPIFDQTTGALIDSQTVIASQTVKVTTNYFTLNPAIRFNIGEVYGFVGPSIGIALSGTASFTSTLPESPNDSLYYNFNTPQQSRTATTGDLAVPDMKTRVALDLGVGKYFEIAPKTFLVPEIDLDLGLTDINNAAAKMSSIQLILGLRFE